MPVMQSLFVSSAVGIDPQKTGWLLKKAIQSAQEHARCCHEQTLYDAIEVHRKKKRSDYG